MADSKRRIASHTSPQSTPGISRIAFGRVFRPECVEIIRGGTGRSSVISLLVRTLSEQQHIDRQHAEDIIGRLMDKERFGASAPKNSLAFPHLRTRDVSQFVGAIGIADDGIQFGSADGQLTRMIFLTLSPLDAREEHSILMSRLFALTTDKVINLQLGQRIRPKAIYEHLIKRDETIAASVHLDG